MAITNKGSVLAIKVEATEGTPISPTLATDYIALQDDFDMSPAIESLENAEIKASIGKSKPIPGVENPTASMSHYLRHSGVEGTAPNFSAFLKGAFGGQDVEAVEYNTIAASTVGLIKVDTGEGASFIRGQALLVKDTTNGYSIRPVKSVSGDNLTIGFNLSSAPAVGMNLGKAITFYPLNTGANQSMSLWHYLANSGAIQLLAGGKIASVDITFTAGQMINVSYSIEGIKYYFNPIEITSITNKIDFDDGGGENNVSITAKVYKDPHELATAIQTAMQAATSDTITVTYSNTTGKYTIASSGASLSLLWKTGVNGSDNTDQHIGSKIGFLDAADDTLALTYTSDGAISFIAPQTPTYDNSDPLIAKSNEAFIGGATDNVCWASSEVTFNLSNTRSVINSICSETGIMGSLISAREAKVTVKALLSQYEADKFRKYREGEETSFMYNFGTKSAGNWQAGKCGCLYLPTCTISNFKLSNADGLIALDLELTAYVNSSNEGECYLSLV